VHLITFAEESSSASNSAVDSRRVLSYDDFLAHRRSKEVDRQSHFQTTKNKKKNKQAVSVSVMFCISRKFIHCIKIFSPLDLYMQVYVENITCIATNY